MSEYDFSARDQNVSKEDVEVSFDNADVSWGFKLSQKAAEPTDKKIGGKGKEDSEKKKKEDEALEK